jgi:arylsulfatase A-like enzyme
MNLRLTAFALLAPLVAGGILSGSNHAQAAGTKPNLIIILTDDQGYADLSVQGVVGDVRTPHIDRMAREGVRLTSGYITAPQCSPSRAGLITGRYQQRFGFDSIPDCPLPLEEITIAERLREAGYVSGHVGKWHLDPNPLATRWIRQHLPDQAANARNRITIPEPLRRAYSPLAQGFDDCFAGETTGYFATYDLEGRSLSPQGQRVVTRGRYRIDVQTEAALAFLRRHHQRPFFLYLNYYGPHVPLEATPKYLDRFPGEMPERRRYALAMMSAIDDGVGRILAALGDYGIDGRTLVAFTSDNGAPLQIHKEDKKPVDLISADWDGSLNEPWIGEKGMLTEGGIRVPFVLRWPGTLPAGRVYDQPVISLDLAATAVAMAGLPADGQLDGVNLIPFLTGEKPGPPDRALYWRFWNQAAIRAANWKYLKVGDSHEFLFDLGSDAHETQNLLGAHPDVARRLRTLLGEWTAQLPPPTETVRVPRQEARWYGHYLGIPTPAREPSLPAVHTTDASR